jgi:adenylate kinase family enzyme
MPNRSALPLAAPSATAMHRIAVIGCAGSGKSTFARRLGERLGMPVTHLDTLFWRPGWTETPKDEWQETVSRLVAEERWLIDGDYGGTLETRLQAADTVIYLDMPRRVCMWRVVKRWAHKRKSRPDMTEGCPERLNFQFLKWVWQYPNVSRPKTVAALASTTKQGANVYVLRSSAEVDEFLAIAAPGSRE